MSNTFVAVGKADLTGTGLEVYFADSPMKKSLQLVMFDLDGTLADTGHDLADSVNFTRESSVCRRCRSHAVYANVGRGVEHLLKQSLPEAGPEKFPQVMQVFLAHYETHLLDRTVLYPGVAGCPALFWRQAARGGEQQNVPADGGGCARAGRGRRSSTRSWAAIASARKSRIRRCCS